MEWTQRHENEICPPVWWHIAWPIHSAYVLCYILFAETKPRFICEYSSVGFEFYFVILFYSRCCIIGNRWLCNNRSYQVVQFKCWFIRSRLFYNHSYTTISFYSFCSLLYVFCILILKHYFLEVFKTCNKLLTLMKWKHLHFNNTTMSIIFM